MPTTLFISPQTGADLANRVSLRFNARDGLDQLSDYKVYLDGAELPDPVLESGVYRLWLDTSRYANGERELTAKAVHPVDGEVEETITVEFSNSLPNQVEYHAWRTENAHEGERITHVNAHLKSFEPPGAARVQCWGQLALVTDSTPQAAALTTPLALQAVGALWEQAQLVPLQVSKVTPALREQPGATIRYASHVLLDHPGQQATALMRMEPVEYLSWWGTSFQAGVKLRRNVAECSDGTEVWYALYRNLDGSGAGIFRYEVTDADPDSETTLTYNPEVNFTQAVDLMEHCPDAVDFCVQDDKVYVLRAANDLIYVFDRHANDYLVALKLVEETRKPVLIETVGETPVVICVDEALEEAQTSAWQLNFPAFRKPWLLDAVVERTGVVSDGTTSILNLAAGRTFYTSERGTGLPTAVHLFEAEITSLGADGTTPLIGLTDGALYQQEGAAFEKIHTLPEAVLASGAWKSDGETQRTAAGYAANILHEEGTDGEWGAGAELIPPSNVPGTVARVTGLESFERLVKAASGTVGDPDFVPAEYDRRLLIMTGNSGFFATLQRSALSEARGAFLVREIDELTLVALTSPLPADL